MPIVQSGSCYILYPVDGDRVLEAKTLEKLEELQGALAVMLKDALDWSDREYGSVGAVLGSRALSAKFAHYIYTVTTVGICKPADSEEEFKKIILEGLQDRASRIMKDFRHGFLRDDSGIPMSLAKDQVFRKKYEKLAECWGEFLVDCIRAQCTGDYSKFEVQPKCSSKLAEGYVPHGKALVHPPRSR